MRHGGATVTWKGRVVYNRKPHIMTAKDAARILAHMNAQQDAQDVPVILRILQRITKYMIESILSLVGAGALTDEVYDLVYGAVDSLLRALALSGRPYPFADTALPRTTPPTENSHSLP